MKIFSVLIFSALSGFGTLSFAQQLCPSIEGKTLTCVPAPGHGCYMNKNCEVDGGLGKCTYSEELTFRQVFSNQDVGPIRFNCADWYRPPGCTGGDVANCPGAHCIRYFTPACDEKCINCTDETVEIPEVAKGCIVCTRPKCRQIEPTCAPHCPYGPPPGYENKPEMVLTKLVKCPVPIACPREAVDPLGNTHTVTITRGQCAPRPTRPRPDPSPPEACRWEIDPFPGLTDESQCPSEAQCPPPTPAGCSPNPIPGQPRCVYNCPIPGWVMPPPPSTTTTMPRM